MKNILITFLSLFLLYGCKARNMGNDGETAENKPQKTGNKPKDANLPMDNKFTFYENVLIHPKFERLKINSKLSIESDSYLPTLDVTTYIQKDQKVWMNISAFLFNAARGIATPEGIKAYNKSDKTYIDSDFEYLNNLLNVNFIDYASLEKLLVGRTFIPIKESQFQITKNMTGYKVVSLVDQEIVTEEKTRKYKVEMDYSNDYDLTRVFIKDAETPDALEVTYSQWEPYKDFRLPKNVKIIIKGTKNNQILMENTKFDDSRMETPFNVPSSYSKIEIR